ncbi:MAG: SDR family oxidoreductase [Planctomycetota bacterium]|nr:SDR family oxidoreductase [Planctomycetota bacterium]
MAHSPFEGAWLQGRKALVTGASQRIGRALSLALARAGADVALHYRTDEAGARETAAYISDMERRAPVLQADLGDVEACEGLASAAHDALGGLDILINNAAIFERTPLETLTVHDFDRHTQINARSVYALTLAAGRRMKAEGGGDVVNLVCISAWKPYPDYVPYNASKAAVANLTRSFAKVLAPDVRVNGIAPGPILPAASEAPGQGEQAVADTLLKRWGTPEDIAGACLFFLRARYVTGYTLAVDGGRSIA